MLHIQEKTKQEIADLKHNLGTLQSNQLQDDERALIYERLKYQITIVNNNVTNSQSFKMEVPSKQRKSATPKQIVVLPRITKSQPVYAPEPKQQHRTAKKQVGTLKKSHLYKPKILPKEQRDNPFAEHPMVENQQLDDGVYNLLLKGVIPKQANVNAAFRSGGELIQTKTVQYATEKSKFYSSRVEDLTRYKVAPIDKLPSHQMPKSMTYIQYKDEHSLVKSQESQAPKLVIEIKNNHYVPNYVFMSKYLHIWGAIQQVLRKLEKIASGQLDGNRVAKLALSQFQCKDYEYYSCFLSDQIMRRLLGLRRKQFNESSAIIKIQSIVRMFIEYRKYQHSRKIVQKVIRIQKEFRLKQQYLFTIREVRKRLGIQISTLNARQDIFKQKILSGQRVEIHLPSYSLTSGQRSSMSNFRSRESLQLPRLFALLDPQITIIYVCLDFPEEVQVFYQKLLEIAGIEVQDRLHFVVPENYNRFPQHFSLAQLLYFSPKALFQIKSLIRERPAYIVPHKVGKEEFIIAEILQVNIYSGPPQQVLNVQRKSVAKDLFSQLGIPVVNGCQGIVSEEDFIDKLSYLIYKNMNVTKWIFKVDHEFNGRGTASFSLEGVKQFMEMKKNTANIHYEDLRELVKALLPIKTQFAFSHMFDFKEYMKYFIDNGGVIEMFQWKSQTVNVHFIIEPNGSYIIKNTSQSLVIKDVVRVGCVFPQTALNMNFESLIQPLASSLYQQGLFGYCTLSLLSHNGLFQAKSIRFGMDDYHAALNLTNAMETDSFSYFPFLYHPGLADHKYTDLFAKCRKEGIAFDIEKKSGTLLLMSDEIQKGIISLLCLGAPKKSIKMTTESLNFILQFGGNMAKTTIHSKQDLFYFIDIVSRVRNINSELEQ